MAESGEQAIAGTTNGLMELNETVTWKAKHLRKTRILKSKITAMNRPLSFTDEMLEGDFKHLRHEHHFKAINNGTLHIDLFSFDLPYGPIGELAGKLYLTRYLTELLQKRNKTIKEYAESDKWKFVLTR